MNTEISGIEVTMRHTFVALIITVLASCATPPPVVKQAPVFYPDAPSLPRIQFLTYLTGAKEIEPERTAFETFIVGEKEKSLRLDKPYGVAMHRGKIYVCDTNSTVMVFDLDKKTFLPMQGAQGLGKLVQPLNIWIEKDGTKYVTDPVRGQVVVFDANDFFVTSFGRAGEWKPVDAVTYEDRLYVADVKNSEVRVFDKRNGSSLKTIGKAGDLSAHLGIPTSLAFDQEGYLYVSDAGRFQVLKYDRDGHLIQVFGRLGTETGAFARPKGIAVDRASRLFAVDAAFDNVQVFSRDGRMLMFFGMPGDKPGNLFLPARVSIDYDDVSYFSSYADPGFEVEYLVLVTSQFGDRMVNVYGFGKKKGVIYPSEEELLREFEKKRQKFIQEHPDMIKEEETQK